MYLYAREKVRLKWAACGSGAGKELGQPLDAFQRQSRARSSSESELRTSTTSSTRRSSRFQVLPLENVPFELRLALWTKHLPDRAAVTQPKNEGTSISLSNSSAAVQMDRAGGPREEKNADRDAPERVR